MSHRGKSFPSVPISLPSVENDFRHLSSLAAALLQKHQGYETPNLGSPRPPPLPPRRSTFLVTGKSVSAIYENVIKLETVPASSASSKFRPPFVPVSGEIANLGISTFPSTLKTFENVHRQLVLAGDILGSILEIGRIQIQMLELTEMTNIVFRRFCGVADGVSNGLLVQNGIAHANAHGFGQMHPNSQWTPRKGQEDKKKWRRNSF